MIFPSMGREVLRIVAPQLRVTALGAFAALQDVACGLTGPLAGLLAAPLADRAGYDAVFLAGTVAAAAGLAVAVGLRAQAPRALPRARPRP